MNVENASNRRLVVRGPATNIYADGIVLGDRTGNGFQVRPTLSSKYLR